MWCNPLILLIFGALKTARSLPAQGESDGRLPGVERIDGRLEIATTPFEVVSVDVQAQVPHSGGLCLFSQRSRADAQAHNDRSCYR